MSDHGNTSFVNKLLSGACGGVVGVLTIYPIDNIKTRLQNQRKSGSVTSGANVPPRYTGIVDCFRQVVRREGFRGLYRGLGANLVGITPEKAIKLGVNDYMRERFASQLTKSASAVVTPDKLPWQYGMLSGAIAGFCQVIATNPMEIVKIQLQLGGEGTKSTAGITEPKQSALQLVRSLGLTGLYRGTFATLSRDVPFSILFFPGVAYWKSQFADAQGHVGLPGVLGSGVLAGAVAAWAVTPMDVVKTRLQASSSGAGQKQYSGMLDCYKDIWRKEGPRAFFNGALSRVLIIAPLFSIAVLVYEVQQRYLTSAPKQESTAATKSQ